MLCLCDLWCGVEEEDNFVYVLVLWFISSLCKMSRFCAASGRQTEALSPRTFMQDVWTITLEEKKKGGFDWIILGTFKMKKFPM